MAITKNQDWKISDNKHLLVDIFPYKIKNREKFYNRNHPVDLNPNTRQFNRYWHDNQLPKCIEGHWVDDEGTWVYMMPKLYTYVNIMLIPDKARNPIQPILRDNEWIIFSYLMGIDGFSGFEDDPDYTCNYLVGELEQGRELDEVQLQSISDNCKKPDGSFKTYKHPWEYLTRTYLVDDPRGKPLGKPLYENALKNGMIFTARGIGKSLTMFVGDLGHELMFSGIKYMSEILQVNRRVLFGAGCGTAAQLQRSINNLQAFWYNMPGAYEYPKKDSTKKYMGYFFKRLQGSWLVGNTLEHIVKDRSGQIDIQGSSLEMVAVTKDRKTILAGDRAKRLYVEEVGFLPYVIDVHAANKDSMRIGDEKVGSSIYLGTGGDMKAVRQPNTMFKNPNGYEIFSIPNYWKGGKKRIGLFIPRQYALNKYKDDQGNTKLELAFDKVLKDREKSRLENDSVSYDIDISYNPIEPDEILRPSGSSIIPKQEAAAQISWMEAHDVMLKKGIVGKLVLDPSADKGVRYDVDTSGALKPIITLNQEEHANKSGAWIMYEAPPRRIPNGLYFVLYDPARYSGQGESYHSILVYKYLLTGNSGTLEDTIVAEWIGRKTKLDDNYKEAIKAARYFNATIFPEVNEPGFVEWCAQQKYLNMLETDAQEVIEKEISPGAKRSHFKIGFRLTPKIKKWCLKNFKSWVLDDNSFDPVTGLPTHRVIDRLYSLRLLNEMTMYNEDDNFDHISAALGIPLLRRKLSSFDPPQDAEYTDEDYEMTKELEFDNYFTRRKQAGIMQY